jgi:molybdenum-dependent DNA-binding transcriptional regulator ModE
MGAPRYRIDEGLKPYATDTQRKYIDAVNEHGSVRKAAKSLGINNACMIRGIHAAERVAALRGYAPGKSGLDGRLSAVETLKGRSVLHDMATGEDRLVWIKTDVKEERKREIAKAALEAMTEELPRLASLPAPSVAGNENLCSCYVITDFHLGMLSHHEETGADWDLKIAERTLLEWFAQAIAQAPNSKVGVFAQLSDFLHADGLEPLTPASKHVLDVDSRFQKVVRTAIRVLRQVVDMLLLKHERLHIVMADANHDPVSQVWMREWFSVLYENEPRVTVDRSPSPYNAFEFGKVALFFHHGHKRKVSNVSEVFAAQFREIFGRTKYAYAHTGHLHSIDVKENNLMVVEQHRTLAAPDAYAARGGWLSGRDAKVITYHREFGEVSRLTVSSDMLKEPA